MQSIKLTDEEKAARTQPVDMVEGMPDYPYGTCICLDETTLKKLGIDKLPAPGSVVEVFFRGVVTRAEVEPDGDVEGMSIQMMEMDPPKVVKSDAETLYGGE